MFALPPLETDIVDLQPLSDAIDTLRDIIDGDRAAFIEGLTDIVRRCAEFEEAKLRSDWCIWRE